jgi:sirohydrochlorin cobaltochelatase
MHTGLILFAHGSRDPLWHQPLQAVQARLQAARPELLVALAYLEISSPDLSQCALDLVAQGCTQVHVLPMFLGSGRHVREDLPALVQALRQRCPQIDLHLSPPIGEDPRLMAFLADLALTLVPKSAA